MEPEDGLMLDQRCRECVHMGGGICAVRGKSLSERAARWSNKCLFYEMTELDKLFTEKYGRLPGRRIRKHVHAVQASR